MRNLMPGPESAYDLHVASAALPDTAQEKRDSIIEVINNSFNAAIRGKAQALEFVAGETGIHVRMHMGGANPFLADNLPANTAGALFTSLRARAGMDITQRNIAQSGEFTHKTPEGKEYVANVILHPDTEGRETAVVRFRERGFRPSTPFLGA